MVNGEVKVGEVKEVQGVKDGVTYTVVSKAGRTALTELLQDVLSNPEVKQIGGSKYGINVTVGGIDTVAVIELKVPKCNKDTGVYATLDTLATDYNNSQKAKELAKAEQLKTKVSKIQEELKKYNA